LIWIHRLIPKLLNCTFASDVQYLAWTFGGTVPGPVLHVLQGQIVNVRFINNGTVNHSIDFYAAQVAPDILTAPSSHTTKLISHLP
jgi:FtsP/CotA-like multicopper oxidase with cupredoxin domain